MPLDKSKSKAAFKKNIESELSAAKGMKQAVAIAYNVKNKAPKQSSKPMKRSGRGR